MTDNDRRNPTTQTLIKWISVIVGTFTIVGTIVGAAIGYDRHVRLDEAQDEHLKEHNIELRNLSDRVRDLEIANRYSHGDNGLLTHAPKDKP